MGTGHRGPKKRTPGELDAAGQTSTDVVMYNQEPLTDDELDAIAPIDPEPEKLIYRKRAAVPRGFKPLFDECLEVPVAQLANVFLAELTVQATIIGNEALKEKNPGRRTHLNRRYVETMAEWRKMAKLYHALNPEEKPVSLILVVPGIHDESPRVQEAIHRRAEKGMLLTAEAYRKADRAADVKAEDEPTEYHVPKRKAAVQEIEPSETEEFGVPDEEADPAE